MNYLDYRSHQRVRQNIRDSILRSLLPGLSISRGIDDAEVGKAPELHSRFPVAKSKGLHAGSRGSPANLGARVNVLL